MSRVCIRARFARWSALASRVPRAGLSQPLHSRDRRSRPRHHRTAVRRQDHRSAGAAGRGRAASRRGRNDRGAGRRRCAERRLHAAAGERVLHHQHRHGPKPARSRPGLCADRTGRNRAVRAGGASCARGKQPRRAGRAGQGQSRQAQLCVLGHRHAAAPRRRAVQVHGRRRYRARAVSRSEHRAQRRRERLRRR